MCGWSWATGIEGGAGANVITNTATGVVASHAIAQTLAANLLTGRDAFGMEFLAAYRGGELA